jgi:hypothetical protein
MTDQLCDGDDDERLDAVMPRLLPLLSILGSGTDGEVVNAVSSMRRILDNVDLDMHAVVERFRNPRLNETEAKEIFEAGYNHRKSEEPQSPKVGSFFSTTSFSGYDHTNDFELDVGYGLHGYSWRDIVCYCALHANRLRSDNERKFVTGFCKQLSAGVRDAPSPKQARWLRDIFAQYFNSKIV